MFSVSLSISSWWFTNVLLITFQPITFKPVDYTTIFCYVVFILWSHQFLFNVLPLLKCSWMPNFLPMFLKLSLSPLLYGTVIEVLLLVLLLFVLLLFLFCFGLFFFSIILCMAHEGYLHAVSALSTYFNSSFSCSWLEQMLVALCNKELITLHLLAM